MGLTIGGCGTGSTLVTIFDGGGWGAGATLGFSFSTILTYFFSGGGSFFGTGLGLNMPPSIVSIAPRLLPPVPAGGPPVFLA